MCLGLTPRNVCVHTCGGLLGSCGGVCQAGVWTDHAFRAWMLQVALHVHARACMHSASLAWKTEAMQTASTFASC
jgi:7-keto-8-aminopelargonate synthetase-like enzyme